MKRRILPLLLTLCLVLALLPGMALADEAYEARVGNTYYEDVMDALKEAPDGSTIILLKNVTKEGPGSYMDGTNKSFVQLTENKDLTLELNGRTLTLKKIGQMYDTNGGIEVKAGSLTIQDSVGGGEITGTSRWGGAPLLYSNSSTIILKSGTLSMTTEVFSTHPGCNNCVVSVATNGRLIMNGGAITTQDADDADGNNYCSGGVYVFAGSAELNGGTISVQGGQAQALLTQHENASVALNGTDLTSETYGLVNYGGTVTMRAGDIQAQVIGVYLYSHAGAAEMTITGGTVYAPDDSLYVTETGKLLVSGGSYSHSVNGAYLDEKFNAELKSDGDTDTPYSYYTSVEAALAAAQPGDEVKALDLSADTETVTVTFDYNDGTDPVEMTLEKGTSFTLPEGSDRAGYYFRGWYAGDHRWYPGGKEVTVEADTTFTAQWGKYVSSPTVDTYPVFVAPTEHGTISVTPNRAAEDAAVTVTVTPDEGYALETITVISGGKTVPVSGSGSRYTFTMPAGSVTVQATFRQVSKLPFVDVDSGDWFYDAVVYAYENGLMEGVSATRFAPDRVLTRAMVAQVLYNLEGAKPGTPAVFDDVAATAWYADAVNWAAANELVEGFGKGKFRPDDSVTREQLAAILFRYEAFKGHDVSARGSLSAFPDGGDVAAWAEEAVTWAVGADVLQGTASGLAPKGTATRAQLAQLLLNLEA